MMGADRAQTGECTAYRPLRRTKRQGAATRVSPHARCRCAVAPLTLCDAGDCQDTWHLQSSYTWVDTWVLQLGYIVSSPPGREIPRGPPNTPRTSPVPLPGNHTKETNPFP